MTAGLGTFSAALATAGSQTLTATDTTTGITGTTTISAVGLAVTSLTVTPSGFVAVFNEPFNPTLNLYDASTANFGPPDVTLVGPAPSTEAVRGSLLIDPTDTTITFVKTSDFIGSDFNPSTGVLAVGTYTLTSAQCQQRLRRQSRQLARRQQRHGWRQLCGHFRRRRASGGGRRAGFRTGTRQRGRFAQHRNRRRRGYSAQSQQRQRCDFRRVRPAIQLRAANHHRRPRSTPA